MIAAKRCFSELDFSEVAQTIFSHEVTSPSHPD